MQIKTLHFKIAHARCACLCLKIGDTLASFQSDGKIPVSSDLLKIFVKEGATTSAAIFSSLFGICQDQ